MPTVCAVYGCTNTTTNKTLSFYRFPKMKTNSAPDLKNLMDLQRNAWLKSLHRLDLMNKKLDHMRVCSVHFKNGKPAAYSDNKHPDWCPSVNMGYNVVGGAATTLDINRYQRASKRMTRTPSALFSNNVEQKKEDESTINENINEEMDISNLEAGTSTSTSLTMVDIQKLQQKQFK